MNRCPPGGAARFQNTAAAVARPLGGFGHRSSFVRGVVPPGRIVTGGYRRRAGLGSCERWWYDRAEGVVGVGSGRRIPEFLLPLFWDVCPDSLLPGHERFVIERILNYGDVPAMKWMWRTFGDDMIISVVRNSPRLTRKAATFWALVYDLPPGEVRSLVEGRPEGGWAGVS